MLGLVEVTLSGIGTGAMQASARPVAPFAAGGVPGGVSPGTTASGLHLALNTVPGGDGSIQLAPVSTGSFTTGTRGSDGERYLYATFEVRNAQSDGTVYSDARQNLTFLAVSTASTITGTPISQMKLFDGSDAAATIAAAFQPTGAVEQDRTGSVETRFPDVLQVLTETEATAVSAPVGTKVFPYGFVVSNPNDPTSRTLPGGPAAGQFDGVVTFAFKVPLQATSAQDPFTVSAMFLAVDDDQTRLTQSVEEQAGSAESALETRATSLGASALTLLPRGDAFLGSDAQRVVCSVRTAGAAGSATATLDLPDGSVPWLLPAPSRVGPYLLPRTGQLTAARCPSIASADANSFVVQGFQSGRLSGSYTGVGTSLVKAPAAPGAGFFPGEEVEVTLTTALGGATPVVARYRVAASGGTGSFTSADSTVGSSPVSVVAADLDGDGDIDLAVVNKADNDISILKNDGSGRFTSTTITPTGLNTPKAATGADLDGDGDVDLAVANGGDSKVVVLLNDGTGNFTSSGTPGVGNFPLSVTAADLDGDGDLDLATANNSAGTVSVLLNDGAGTFTSAGSDVAVGDGPTSVVAADLDGDGDLDLATANSDTTNTVSILLNNGAGTFTSAGPDVAIGADPNGIVAADLDGDGDVDLATANSAGHSVSILLNDGAGTFTRVGTDVTVGGGPTSIVAADLDGDGDFDLAVPDGVTSVVILQNDGAGAFTNLGTAMTGNGPVFITAADLDGDGDVDLATPNTNAPATVSILKNQ